MQKKGCKHSQHYQRNRLQEVQITTETDVLNGHNKVTDMWDMLVLEPFVALKMMELGLLVSGVGQATKICFCIHFILTL